MPESTYLTTGEFERAQRQQTSILLAELRDIKRVQGSHGSRLAAVETKIDERSVSDPTRMTRKAASGWGGAAAGVVLLVVEMVKAWMK